MIVVCKKYYIETLIKELGISTTNISPKSTYIPSTDSFDEIVKSHCKYIESVGLEMSEEDKNLLYLYWTPKLHRFPFKHCFIAGSSKCTTNNLSCLLAKVLTTVKDGLIKYNNTKTIRNGVNSMWIVRNSTSLLSSLDQLDVRTATSVQTYDFSHQSHTICFCLKLLHLYTTHSRGEMEVTDSCLSICTCNQIKLYEFPILAICTSMFRPVSGWTLKTLEEIAKSSSPTIFSPQCQKSFTLTYASIDFHFDYVFQSEMFVNDIDGKNQA